MSNSEANTGQINEVCGPWVTGNKSQRATSQRCKSHRPRGQTEAAELPRVQIPLQAPARRAPG